MNKSQIPNAIITKKEKEDNMSPIRSYLLKAFYDWISDNGCTPYLLVNAHIPGVQIPTQYVEDGKIVLNISSQAVVGLKITPHTVSFGTSFASVHYDIYIPMPAVDAIFAKENSRGMVFDEQEEFYDNYIDENDDESGDSGQQIERLKTEKMHPHLVVVK